MYRMDAKMYVREREGEDLAAVEEVRTRRQRASSHRYGPVTVYTGRRPIEVDEGVAGGDRGWQRAWQMREGRQAVEGRLVGSVRRRSRFVGERMGCEGDVRRGLSSRGIERGGGRGEERAIVGVLVLGHSLSLSSSDGEVPQWLAGVELGVVRRDGEREGSSLAARDRPRSGSSVDRDAQCVAVVVV
jgi:hypothetical protein